MFLLHPSRVRVLALLSTCALLVVLAGCGGGGSNAPANTTPLALPTKAATATAAATTSSNVDWTTYHRDSTRTGALTQAPDPQRLAKAWSAQLDGEVFAEPLVIGKRLIVATEQNSLYSLDPETGKVQWHTNVGSPTPLSSLPCGDIDPLGITGTPVYDPQTGLVFAVAEVNNGAGHLLVGIDVQTGQVRVRRSADVAGMDPRAHQQRAALALSHGMVYIAYGGLDGDCSDYRGTVVASRTDGNGPLLFYRVPTTREGGIWATSGPSVDAAGNIYVAVGNGEASGGSWDHTDSILRLSPMLQLEDGFAPTSWAQDNASDADLGSMGPVLLPEQGLIFSAGKSGQGYLLHANALGGIGGQVQVEQVCRAFGGAATLGAQVFVPCTDGIRQIIIGPGDHMSLGWRAPAQVTHSPAIGGHTVYSLSDDGTLYALDINSGAVRTTFSVGPIPHFVTPTVSGNLVFVGTQSGVVALSIS